jgi:hypothetical protein
MGTQDTADQPVMVACKLPVLRKTKKNQWVHPREVTRDNYRNVAETGMRHHAFQEIVEGLGYWKIFVHCFLYC